jgi:phosphinothricin acetyltransferase
MDTIIEGMTPADWEPVRAIYSEGIASGQATFEVEAPLWEDWDAGHHPFARLVARSGGEVVGWAALSPVSRRRCYAGVAEVSVYVRARHQARGIGKKLLLELIAESEQHGIWTLQGATFPENKASLRLQRACGFRELGRRERVQPAARCMARYDLDRAAQSNDRQPMILSDNRATVGNTAMVELLRLAKNERYVVTSLFARE